MKVISVSKRNIFPVIDEENKLVGIITLDDVRDIMFLEEKQNTVAIDSIVQKPPAIIEYGEPIQDMMQKFDRTQAWNLPVVENGTYMGIISKSRIFNIYRKKLIKLDT